MTSLTVEMGLRRRRGDSPPLPEEVARRDDMTLAQKQRLAVLAKMGVGPIATPTERLSARQEIRESIGGPPAVDRRAILLERERRLREQRLKEEKKLEEEERALEEKKKQKVVRFAGIARLGPVMPREDEVPQFLPAPAQEPEVRRHRDKASEPFDPEEENGEDSGAEVAPALQKPAAARGEQRPKRPEEPPPPPKAKRKRRRRARTEEGGEEQLEEDWEEEDWPEENPPAPVALPQQQRKRDGGISKQTMVVESVKGKVSHANKNLTDADLERRFPLHDSGGAGAPGPGGLAGSLMTEEEVLKLIRRERKEKGGGGTASAARRVQRELAEWENAKEVQRARVKSPHRFERMVVARK